MHLRHVGLGDLLVIDVELTGSCELPGFDEVELGYSEEQAIQEAKPLILSSTAKTGIDTFNSRL